MLTIPLAYTCYWASPYLPLGHMLHRKYHQNSLICNIIFIATRLWWSPDIYVWLICIPMILEFLLAIPSIRTLKISSHVGFYQWSSPCLFHFQTLVPLWSIISNCNEMNPVFLIGLFFHYAFFNTNHAVAIYQWYISIQGIPITVIFIQVILYIILNSNSREWEYYYSVVYCVQ